MVRYLTPPRCLAIVIFVGLVRIASTYPVFSDVTDENVHVATGMEWLDRGSYEFEDLHPPLARIFIAAPLYSNGSRLTREAFEAICPESFLEHYFRIQQTHEKGFFSSRCVRLADRALLFRGNYDTNLTLARLGILPFFVLLCVYTYFLGTYLFDASIGLLAAALLSFMPPILAHSGLATTDLALAATFVAALYYWLRFLETPRLREALLLGSATALCLLSKFSAFLFLPLVFALAFLYRQVCDKETFASLFRSLRHLLAAGLTAFLIVWGLYRFSLGKPSEVFPPVAQTLLSMDAAERESSLFATFADAEILPMPELFTGILTVRLKNEKGHAGFVLGRRLENEGVWYFFPVAIFFKTPLSIWLLFGAGLAVTVAIRSRDDRYRFLPALSAAAILVASMPSNINIGVRHVLVIYPFLCLTAAYGAAALWKRRGAARIFVSTVVLWYGAASLWAHPDYLPYFNLAAGAHPEDVLLDSDLDWAQDQRRLLRAIRAREIDELKICGLGRLFFDYHGLEQIDYGCPGEPEPGWFAVRFNYVKVFAPTRLAWLEDYTPVERIGKSMLLYMFE